LTAKISQKTSLAQLAAIVSSALTESGIEAFLSGGAVVSIYTKNKYQSYDLDFVSLEDRKKIKVVMESLGFSKTETRYFAHPNTKFFVEFPGSAFTVGEELIKEFSTLKLKEGSVKLLTPTDCVKDRLAAYFHWNDRQSLEQAVWVAQAQPVKISEIQKWSIAEGMERKYKDFLELLKRK
jgi:hypothetical protein